MKGASHDLDVARSGRDIALANGVVRLRLVFRDGGYSQEFYGIDRSGRSRLLLSTVHRNLIPLTEHRVAADPMISCHRQHLFEVNRESLRMAYSDAHVTKSEGLLSVRLTGRCAENELSSTITLAPGSKFVTVTIEADIPESPRPPILEYLMAAYAFMPDGLLLDQYRRPDYMWAPSLRPKDDHVIGESLFRTAAIVIQHGKLLAAIIPDQDLPRPLPVALDLDLRNGLLAAPLLAYGYCGTEPEAQFTYHDRSMLFRPRPGKISCRFRLYLDVDARLRDGFQPIQQFTWDQARGRTGTGYSPTAVTLADDLPTAYLLKAGQNLSDETRRAAQIIDDVLQRQNPQGVFDLELHPAGPGPYDTAAMSELCRWLLAIHRDSEGDLRLLQACKHYGDFLTTVQLPSGAIPSWFSRELCVLPELRDSAQTGASGRFLAELYESTGERNYFAAACKAGRFVAGLVSKRRYHDRSAFVSGALEIRDQHSSIAPQSATAIRYAADLMVALFRLTSDEKYLKPGITAALQMCWYQDTWSQTPGSFAAGNAFDVPVPDAAFGRTLLEYYAATGEPHYAERGLAAMRAGLAAGDAESAAIQAWAVHRFGYALVDVRSQTAYEIGPCIVDDLTVKRGAVSLALRNGFARGKHSPLTVRFCGMRGESYRVTINGEGKRYPKVELETGIEVGG